VSYTTDEERKRFKNFAEETLKEKKRPVIKKIILNSYLTIIRCAKIHANVGCARLRSIACAW